MRSHRFLSKSPAPAGFTLLELLVVVAILAIIGGGIVVAYDDLDDTASEGVAAHTLSGLDSAVRNYEVMTKNLPNYLDSLFAADYPDDPEDPNTPGTGFQRLLNMYEQFGPTWDDSSNKKGRDHPLSIGEANALRAAGITHLRYVDALANVATGSFPIALEAPDANGNPASSNSILTTDIPSRVFESPRPGNANRGKGFAKAIAAGDTVMLWNRDRATEGTPDDGPGGYDNTKIGAGPNDVIFLFGLGNDATNVGNGGLAARAQLTNAPIYGKNLPHHYARYFVAVNVGPKDAPWAKAKLQCVMNNHGDFVDEMLAEHIGSKP